MWFMGGISAITYVLGSNLNRESIHVVQVQYSWLLFTILLSHTSITRIAKGKIVTRSPLYIAVTLLTDLINNNDSKIEAY